MVTIIIQSVVISCVLAGITAVVWNLRGKPWLLVFWYSWVSYGLIALMLMMFYLLSPVAD